MRNTSAALVLSSCLQLIFGKYETIKIGAVFESTDQELDKVVEAAMDKTNSELGLGPEIRLECLKTNSTRGNSHQASNAVCSLLKQGINVLIGPQSFHSSSRVESLCNWLHVPYITMTEDFRYTQKYDYSVNVAPHPKTLSKAYAALIGQWSWYEEFAVVYYDSEDLFRIQDMLQFSDKRTHLFQMKQLADDRVLIKEIKHKDLTRIVLALKTEMISHFFKMAKDIGITTEYYDYVLPNLDIHTINLTEYSDSRMNVTGFQLIDPTSTEFNDFVLHLRQTDDGSAVIKTLPSDLSIKTEMVLLYDAIIMYARIISELKLNFSEIDYKFTNCEDGTTDHPYQNVMEKLKSSSFRGLTGLLKFDSSGRRTDISVNIVKLMYTDEPSFKQIASWSESSGYEPIFTQAELEEVKHQSLSNITLRVATVLNLRFITKISHKHKISGDLKYEGFIVDLLKEMAKRVNFTYTIDRLIDSYGGVRANGISYGVISELVHKRVDMAAADLIIMAQRLKVVDFTNPFMYVGITILFKKPDVRTHSYFTFLCPFTPELWIYMLTAYLATSILLYIVARLSPYEWITSHPCKGKGKEMTNNFSLANSLWCTIGALTQQGSDVTTKAVSARIIVSIWWFFTLIMISSYTASLAAFLTAAQSESPIHSMEDLARQTKIQYGLLTDGAVHRYFLTHKSEPYTKMWAYMESAQPSVFVHSNVEGVARVKRGGYAFITESSFVDHVVAQDCELMQVGGMIDRKGLGIALPKNSPYWSKINSAVVMAQEDGVLEKLKKRWWTEKSDRQECPTVSQDSTELGIRELGGVFFLLAVGMGIACAIGTVEFLWNVRKKVPLKKGLFRSELQKELKFALNIYKSSKPVVKDNVSIEKDYQTTQL